MDGRGVALCGWEDGHVSYLHVIRSVHAEKDAFRNVFCNQRFITLINLFGSILISFEPDI